MPHTDFWPFHSQKDEITEEASILQKQVGAMEDEVKEIQMELAAIKRERYQIDKRHIYGTETDAIKDSNFAADAVLKFRDEELDFKSEQKLREELIRAKNAADEERFQREKYERKLKDLELKLNSICSSGVVEQKGNTKSEEVSTLKVQLRDMKEEVEEMKITLNEKNEQLQDYRLKYLQAQQQVEEMRRQIDVIDLDNKQVSDQIQIEIQKMKMQFQEKLQELSPLPDLLKGAQIQLHEAKQLQKLAEDSSEQLSNELHRVKEKLVIAVNNLNQEKAERIKYAEEAFSLRSQLEDGQKEIEEQARSINEYKCIVLRLEEKLTQQECLYKEKSSECHHLIQELDELKVESSRSLARAKERSDAMRRYMQTQVSELERQLVQSRAQCRSCQKERDEVRQRMQIQINSLQENFELVEIRLRALQNQITALKNNYSMILCEEEQSSDDKIVTI